jgi:hypothetical protein
LIAYGDAEPGVDEVPHVLAQALGERHVAITGFVHRRLAEDEDGIDAAAFGGVDVD